MAKADKLEEKQEVEESEEQSKLEEEEEKKEDEGEDDDDDDDGDEEEFEVEKIIYHRCLRKKFFYYVKWKGYDESENTWEPHDNLDGCLEMRDQYRAKMDALEKEDAEAYKRHMAAAQRLWKSHRSGRN